MTSQMSIFGDGNCMYCACVYSIDGPMSVKRARLEQAFVTLFGVDCGNFTMVLQCVTTAVLLFG